MFTLDIPNHIVVRIINREELGKQTFVLFFTDNIGIAIDIIIVI